MRLLTIVTLAVTFGLPVVAQDVYARAHYTKWKPGMREEGGRFIKDVAMKTAVNRLKQDPAFVGQITMSRVHPSFPEAGIDRLRLVMTTTPPDLGATVTPAAWLEGTGLTPAAYSAKLSTFYETVKAEIWRSVYRHGSIQAGDFVEVVMNHPPEGKTQEYLSYLKDHESATRAQIVKNGAKKGMEGWQLLLTPQSTPYNFTALAASPDSAGVYKSFGSRAEVFRQAHPGKDYHAYRQVADSLTKTVGRVVFRVDTAVGK